MEIYKAIYLASYILLLSGSVHNTLPQSDSKIHSGWNVFQEQITICTAINWTQWSVLPHLYHLIWYNVGIAGGGTDITNLSQAKMFTENILTSNDQIQCNSIHNLGSGYLQVKFYMFFVSTRSNFNLHLYFMFKTYTFSCSGVLVVWRIWYCMVRSKKYLSRSFHHFAFTCRSQDISRHPGDLQH
jgi:hypothetical protein